MTLDKLKRKTAANKGFAPDSSGSGGSVLPRLQDAVGQACLLAHSGNPTGRLIRFKQKKQPCLGCF